jgi:hypothetical protein
MPPPPVAPPPAAAPALPARAPAKHVEDPFLLPEDDVVDPAELLKAMKHDCCDEMPNAEINAHREPPAGH